MYLEKLPKEDFFGDEMYSKPNLRYNVNHIEISVDSRLIFFDKNEDVDSRDIWLLAFKEFYESKIGKLTEKDFEINDSLTSNKILVIYGKIEFRVDASHSDFKFFFDLNNEELKNIVEEFILDYIEIFN